MEQEDLIERDLTLTVLLPEGLERRITVHSDKPVMDVLVSLCARYHLNPSDHVIELFSTNHNKLKFQPSSLIGSLEAERVLLKPKCSDIRKAANMPVATVRLLINYRKSHKAVVRVSPRVPLAELMPAVCEKCEMDPKTTVLLRDGKSDEPLDLTKTLNDYGIRDLYAKDLLSTPTDPATLTHKDCKKNKLSMQEKVLREKENRGLLGLFRRCRKSAEEPAGKTISTATSLALNDQHADTTGCPDTNSASSAASSEIPKKRPAPQPPSMLGSRGGRQSTLPSAAKERQGVLGRTSSTESSLQRNKRKAPPPPLTSPSLPDTSDKERSHMGCFLNEVEEDGSAKASGNRSGSYKPTCLSVQSSSLMAEVLSEFSERMKTMEQKDTTFDRSVTLSPPASNLLPVAETPDPGPVVPPVSCELLRDGLTFTVVPRRRPESVLQYECLHTIEAAKTINGAAKGTLDGRSSESGDIEKIEMSPEDMVMVEKRDTEFENLKEINKELGEIEGSGSGSGSGRVKLNTNINAEKHVPEDGHDMEDQDDRDWIEKYRERRRRFESDNGQDHGGKEAKVKTPTEVFDEEMLDDVPAPRLPVCWEEEDTETRNTEKTESLGKEEDQAANNFTTQIPNPIRYAPQRDPTSDATYTQEPSCWDGNVSPNLHSFNTKRPFTSSSQSSPHNHQLSSETQAHSKPNPSFKLSPPTSVSLFSVAVSQRVQRLGNTVCPLIPSAGKKSSPGLHPQSVGSQSTTSQKLHFQNLLSQDFVSKISASQGACNETLPTSTALPSGFVASRIRRQSWVSFSRTRLKVEDA